MSRLAYPGISWDKIARLVKPGISQDNNSRMTYPGISLQRYSCHPFHSFPRLAAPRRRRVSGLVTRLRPCPDDHRYVEPFLLSQTRTGPNARPPRPNCHSHGLTSYSFLPLLPSAAAGGIDVGWVEVLPLQKGCDILQFVHCPPELLISGVDQGYHLINWDNPGCPWLLVSNSNQWS